MPIYEYRCASCEQDFEALVRVSADEKSVACPTCSGEQVTRKFSTFAMSAGSEPGFSGPSRSSAPCSPGCGCHM